MKIWGGAAFSGCGTYRYDLHRWWELSKSFLGFVMLNPSTADASQNDPTIRKCIKFAQLNGYGGVIIRNLLAFRSPDPNILESIEDPVGPKADLFLENLLTDSRIGRIMAAWGRYVPFDRDKEFIRMAKAHKKKLGCLGKTQNGMPRHPLYVPYTQGIENYP